MNGATQIRGVCRAVIGKDHTHVTLDVVPQRGHGPEEHVDLVLQSGTNPVFDEQVKTFLEACGAAAKVRLADVVAPPRPDDGPAVAFLCRICSVPVIPGEPSTRLEGIHAYCPDHSGRFP